MFIFKTIFQNIDPCLLFVFVPDSIPCDFSIFFNFNKKSSDCVEDFSTLFCKGLAGMCIGYVFCCRSIVENMKRYNITGATNLKYTICDGTKNIQPNNELFDSIEIPM